MSQNTKKIRELEKKMEGLKRSLSDAKIDLGSHLLEKDALFVEYGTAVQTLEQQKNEGARLEGQLKELTGSISENRTAGTRLEKELDGAIHGLGLYLFEHADSSVSEAFAVHNRIRATEAELDRIEAELNAASFFKKLPMQVKRGSLLSTLGSEKKKLEQLLDRQAKTVVQEQLVTAENGGPQYDECRRLTDEIQTLQSQNAELVASKATVEAARQQTQSDIERTQAQVRQLKAQCDEKASQEGDSYAGQYIGEKAAVLKNFPNSQKKYLDAILQVARQIADAERNLEILNIEDAIADCNSQIERMQAEFEANQRAVSQLQERNERLLENINGSKSLIENYEGRRSALEAETESLQ
ncbi:MAG: hypothetical protein MJ178_02805 [Treponemataceae bacterium]|nr:hypothetical protein [Treponemataceae bacterium]